MKPTKVAFELELPGEGPKGTWLPVRLPPEVHARLGGDRKRIPIAGTADGHPIRTSAAPMGGCHLFPFNKEMQAATGKKAGQLVKFVLWRDEEERTVDAPADLAKALAKRKAAREAFETMSYTHRREYVRWIEEAKRPETRQRRVEKALELLEEGKPAR